MKECAFVSFQCIKVKFKAQKHTSLPSFQSFDYVNKLHKWWSLNLLTKVERKLGEWEWENRYIGFSCFVFEFGFQLASFFPGNGTPLGLHLVIGSFPLVCIVIGIHSVQRYMDSEIRAIMAQYMPLDSNQGEFSNHVPHGGVWRWSMKRHMKIDWRTLLTMGDESSTATGCWHFLFHFLHWELFFPFTESYLCIHDRAHKHRTWQLFLGTGTWWISIVFFCHAFFLPLFSGSS